MTITTDATLASIVDANPDAARILEHHQLDYCCGGARSLTDRSAKVDRARPGVR